MEVLNLLNTSLELLNGLVWTTKARTGEKLPAKKTVSSLGWLQRNTHMSGWNTGNNWVLARSWWSIFAQSKKDLETAKISSTWLPSFNTDKGNQITALTNTLNQFCSAIQCLVTVDPGSRSSKMLEKVKSEVLTKGCLTKCKNNTTNSLLLKNKNRWFEKALEESPEPFISYENRTVNENQYFNLPVQIGESVLFLWYNKSLIGKEAEWWENHRVHFTRVYVTVCW